ncbi:MAG: DUF1592 domain-containing protein [Planctomycetaceae bacterium]|nr:DUF1592 domain-containing protein [Planctomycetaceae bacterium]
MFFKTNLKFVKQFTLRSYLVAVALLLGVFSYCVDRGTTLAAPVRAASFQLPVSNQNQSKVDDFDKIGLPFLENYCLDCHDGADGEGEVDLSTFSTTKDVVGGLTLWGNVLRQVESGRMPPESNSQPSASEIAKLSDWLMTAVAKQAPDGQISGQIRRLNRAEYENTIRDLFRVPRSCFNNNSKIIQTNDYYQPATGKMPRHVLAVSCFWNSRERYSDLPGVSTLPVDPPVEHGFANDQSALSLSPLLMESYLEISNSLLNNIEFAQLSNLWQSLFRANKGESERESIQRAGEQLASFLPRAFRRRVTEAEKLIYLKLFESDFKESKSYTASMITTVSAVLISPNFLFRHEFLSSRKGFEESSSAKRDLELEQNFKMANRLSYFLWGSMPDDELFQAAKERRLLTDKQLRYQVNRMLDDPKSKSLATEFGMQWLKVQDVASVLPDKTLYPGYYVKSNQRPPPAISMMIEQLLFFESVMVENRRITEFVASDYAYLNRQLMDWYSVDPEEVLGYSPPVERFEDFFRIKWPNGHRGGVLSSGAMLISTSTTTRTSPVYRGAWILDVIYNSPPPPAPANVPPLEPTSGEVSTDLSVREKLAKHRENEACATCHDVIDPPGFAFEMFDAVGKWRSTYANGKKVDSSGELRGDAFVGSERFKNVVLRDKSRFVRAFVEHTMKYALGRQLKFVDQPDIRQIAEKVAEQDFRFRTVMVEVVLSGLFRKHLEEIADNE